MKAQVISEFGPPSVFTLSNIPKPNLIPGHVLIKVHATSVNPLDCKIRNGTIAHLAPELPAVLHGDVAGTIVAVAENVDSFKEGDEVYGFAGGIRGYGGALAEYMLANPKFIAKKPASLSMLEAAALPLVSITAWLGFDKVKLAENDSVLIYGGLGGVGHIAVQLARYFNIKVCATVSKEIDFSIAHSLGADEVINYKTEDVASYVKRLTNDKGFDLIFDTVGQQNLENSFAATAFGGTIITTASRVKLDLTIMHEKGLSLHVIFMLLPLIKNIGNISYNSILTKISRIVDEGKLKPIIDNNRFTLGTVREAHTFLELGKADGKIVIAVG